MAFEGSREKIGILGELWAFMKVRKKWWLSPIVVMLALLGLLVVFTANSAVAPLIYQLF
jgi:membrane glycosyltransferase